MTERRALSARGAEVMDGAQPKALSEHGFPGSAARQCPAPLPRSDRYLSSEPADLSLRAQSGLDWEPNLHQPAERDRKTKHPTVEKCR